MNTTEQKAITLNTEIQATSILFKSETGTKWLWGKGESHDPADRCGEPYHVDDLNNDESEEKWFIFSPANSFFPPHWAISARSFEHAYDILGDWKEDYFKIQDPDLKDYDEDSLNYNSSGVPIDMESVQGFEVSIQTVSTD